MGGRWRRCAPALCSLAAAAQTIDLRFWEPERYAGDGCELPRVEAPHLSSERFFGDLVVGSRPTVIRGEAGCAAAAAAAAVGAWADEVLAALAGARLVVAMASTSRDSSFFLTPMHPGWRETRVFREPLALFLERYMSASREENWYTYSNLVPELSRLLPRPSFDRHLRTVVNAKGGEESDRWDGRLWLGYSEDGKQESPLHRDTHENLHCMVQGRKLFTIVDPSLTERLRVPAENLNYSPLHIHAEEGVGISGKRCVLEAGEYLFLPANWWHNVVALAGRNIGINFWYTWWVRPGEVRLLARPRDLRAAFRRVRNTSAAGLASGRKLARRGQVAEALAVFPDATCRLRFGDGATLDFPFEAVSEQLSVARGRGRA